MTNPYIHDPKTPTNFRQPRPIPEHAMNKHIHAEHMLQYAQDAHTTATPFDLWEACDPKSHYPDNGCWYTLKSDPSWNPAFQYRRKPQTHTIVLNTEQLKEIILACEYPCWENGDFVTGVQVLRDALGVQPKNKFLPLPLYDTNELSRLLEKAYDELEEHSALICEPNVDHIQRLVWDARQLLVKGDGE